eukprot:gnl/MRDRNA2_/MRDRNA2_153831_c0_seq1.p2 gnl/MRDRNA2_/MRDRNA2_153831_c0~~gnl/MRDRNA2_/MRDRNA2_153831_c0_seq1.p2  ORF type:complete len:119 (+),score=19.29 gnl/MRDRNA2_/MRDRNA2_153831_c0_seq1:94-450(+)
MIHFVEKVRIGEIHAVTEEQGEDVVRVARERSELLSHAASPDVCLPVSGIHQLPTEQNMVKETLELQIVVLLREPKSLNHLLVTAGTQIEVLLFAREQGDILDAPVHQNVHLADAEIR